MTNTPYSSLMKKDRAFYLAETVTMDSFCAHARRTLKHELGAPWIVTPSTRATDGIDRVMHCTFTERLLYDLTRNPSGWKKDLAALRYGYVGASNGGRNGIVDLREEDVRLRHQYDRFIERGGADAQGISRPEPVKLVVHRPNGLRTIGVRDASKTNGSPTIFFDRSTYTR